MLHESIDDASALRVLVEGDTDVSMYCHSPSQSVLDELLSPTGSSFSICDISEYVHLDREGPLSFWDVALRASDRGQIAVGYKRARDSFLALENRDCEFSLTNPPNKRRERQWKKGDVLVTICRKEHR